MKKKGSLFSPWNFVWFFFTAAFVVSCCMLLFLQNADLPDEFYRKRAPLVFLNVIVISVIFTFIDLVRRKITVERPVKEILKAGKKICEGDFSVRITKTYPREFGVITEQFNKMAEELSGIETLRSDFIANVSHEMKTPIAIITNYAQMLSERDLTEEERIEYAGEIRQATQRFNEMVMNILKLNKLENQRIYPKLTEYPLAAQVYECLMNFDRQLSEKNLTVEADLEENITVFGDEELLSLVWNNLFSNAIKFNRDGGKICVELDFDGRFAELKISDSGCGMSEETGRLIFEKFYQGDTSHHTQGNGLGLALVKGVVDIVGGEISVSSEVGIGTTFTVKLKRGSADEREALEGN